MTRRAPCCGRFLRLGSEECGGASSDCRLRRQRRADRFAEVCARNGFAAFSAEARRVCREMTPEQRDAARLVLDMLAARPEALDVMREAVGP